MRKPNGKVLHITRRDEALFDYLFCNKIATSEQIRRDLFRQISDRVVRRRLALLARFGFLKHALIERAGIRFGYYLSEITFDKYISKRIERPWAQLKSDSPLHDTVLVDLRLRFLQSKKVVRFFTENAIKAELDCVPGFPVKAFFEMRSDAAIILKHNSDQFNLAIEYENTRQSSSKYLGHFTAYYVRPEINGVIYIVRDRKLREQLMQIDKESCAKKTSKIFFGELNTVLNPKASLHFSNSHGAVLKVD